jgi:tRNA pseudouridine13 synthase
MSDLSLPEWPYALGGPSASGLIKSQVDDFIVEEILSFAPEGSGEHVFLFIEKCGENTEYVARALARHASVRQRDVSFAGLKDRYGRTRQWFSVWLPGKQGPDWLALNSPSIQILQVARHARKLKRGVLAGNQFQLIIRNWQSADIRYLQQLLTIQQHGFPNYFTEQRFGRQGQNLYRAAEMFQGASVKRELRSLYLSAARSFLFNLVLAERVKEQNWQHALAGDVFNLNHSHSHFYAETLDASLEPRLASGDIHPTGVLWGKGENGVTGVPLALEKAIISAHPLLAEGLIKAGLEIDRRALRVIPENLQWELIDDNLHLSFQLPAGSYATALLREIVTTV